MTNRIDNFERKGNNLYKLENINTYFRLFAHSITPNGCWLAAPAMIELKDIDVATGNDIYGDCEVELECVPSCFPFVTKHNQ